MHSNLRYISEASHRLQGASTFLQSLASSFGAALFTQLPIVKQLMLQPLLAPQPGNLEAKQATDALQILKIIGPVVHQQLIAEVLQALPPVVHSCGHAQHQVRHMSVICAVELATTHTELVLPVMLRYSSFPSGLHVAPAASNRLTRCCSAPVTYIACVKNAHFMATDMMSCPSYTGIGCDIRNAYFLY